MPDPVLTETDIRLGEEWLTPSTSEIVSVRAAIVAELGASPHTEASLAEALHVERTRSIDVGTVPRGQRLIGDVLNAASPQILAKRHEMAFDEALRQLRHDRVVEAVDGDKPLEVRGYSQTMNGRRGFRELLGPSGAAGLRLVSTGRGWTASDHEAFDAALYDRGSRSRLVTHDGKQLIAEAIDAHRLGRYLSSTIVLGTFAETTWYEAARLIEPQEHRLTRELASPVPKISTVQDLVLGFLRAHSRFLVSNLEVWAVSLRTARNFGAHGNLTVATTGSFTETSSALRIMECYRHVEELEQALQAAGL